MMTELVQRYFTSKYYLQQLKRVTVRDVNDLKQEVVQTKHASQNVLRLVSGNDQQNWKFSPAVSRSTSRGGSTPAPSRDFNV